MVHEEILRALAQAGASYAHPVCSESLAEILNLTPSYVREQVQPLRAMALVEVRRGRGGGYFLRPRRTSESWRQRAEWVESAGWA